MFRWTLQIQRVKLDDKLRTWKSVGYQQSPAVVPPVDSGLWIAVVFIISESGQSCSGHNLLGADTMWSLLCVCVCASIQAWTRPHLLPVCTAPLIFGGYATLFCRFLKGTLPTPCLDLYASVRLICYIWLPASPCSDSGSLSEFKSVFCGRCFWAAQEYRRRLVWGRSRCLDSWVRNDSKSYLLCSIGSFIVWTVMQFGIFNVSTLTFCGDECKHNLPERDTGTR